MKEFREILEAHRINDEHLNQLLNLCKDRNISVILGRPLSTSWIAVISRHKITAPPQKTEEHIRDGRIDYLIFVLAHEMGHFEHFEQENPVMDCKTYRGSCLWLEKCANLKALGILRRINTPTPINLLAKIESEYIPWTYANCKPCKKMILSGKCSKKEEIKDIIHLIDSY